MQPRSNPRQAGILIPAFSPRRTDDLGIGDTRGLRDWIDWAADHGVGFIQLLPINENGPEESPYSAISSVALDPIYLTIDQSEIPWLDAADLERVRTGLGPAIQSAQVDYPAVRKGKRDLLECAWRNFAAASPKHADEFAAFAIAEKSWLEDYCLFRFLMEHHGESLSWDRWPETVSTPAKARTFIAKLRSQDTATVDGRLGFFAFVQWLCFRQWRALRAHADQLGVKLMGDIPIGVSWHSSDVFFNREDFRLDWCGGSPPEGMSQSDPFFQRWGQNWGIPLYHWEHMEQHGFTWWKQRITRHTEIFRMFRLDHILGFYRIYAFPWRPEHNRDYVNLSPQEAEEKTGGRLPRWFEQPDDTPENKAANRTAGTPRLHAVLEAAGTAEVIAEDLGWVPEYVRPHLAELGIAGFRIPHWDCNEFGHPVPGSAFPENSFAAFSTHDHDPVNGIWRNCLATIRRHREQTDEQSEWQANGAHNTLRLLSEFAGIPVPADRSWPAYSEGVRLRLLKSLMASNSRHATIMITELFSLDDRINRPATTGGQNWCFRIPWTVRQVLSDPLLQETCRKFATVISITRR